MTIFPFPVVMADEPATRHPVKVLPSESFVRFVHVVNINQLACSYHDSSETIDITEHTTERRDLMISP